MGNLELQEFCIENKQSGVESSSSISEGSSGIVLPKSPRTSSPTATSSRHRYDSVYPILSGAHFAYWLFVCLIELHLCLWCRNDKWLVMCLNILRTAFVPLVMWQVKPYSKACWESGACMNYVLALFYIN